MKIIKNLVSKTGIVLCSALLGCTTYGQPSISVGVSVPLPSVEVGLPGVEIHAASDFYAPLATCGRWEDVGAYGRCWIPGGVAADWRPYCDGNWQSTDAGWYWSSQEPWAWATYHYGRWNLSTEFGWYWVPQTQWDPSWVSWHSGGGYVGWAPLYPNGVRIIAPQAYVFVEERNFMNPVSRSTIAINNTIIINKTRMNQGPAVAAIEKASGRKIQAVQVQELRHKEETAVAARQRTPVRDEARPGEKKAAVTHEPPRITEPAGATRKQAQPSLKNNDARSQESKPEGNRAPAIQEPTRQNAEKQPVKQEKSVQPSEKKAPQPAREKPEANKKGESDSGDKGRQENNR